MKNLLIALATTTVVMVASNPSQAQFFKNLVKNVKQTVENRTTDKTTAVTNKGIDRIENAPSSMGSKGAKKTSADSMNLAMKYLSKVLVGKGVSSADSAAAIKSFMRARGGSGLHYQYITSFSGKDNKMYKTTSNSDFCSSGYGRSELNISGMMAAASTGVKAGPPLVVIQNTNHRQYSVILDDAGREYSLNVIDTAFMNGSMKYQATKIGTETVNGYSCTHARVTSGSGKGMFKTSSTLDTWTSTDVPGYDMFKKWLTTQNDKPGLMEALAQVGCAGFLVKMAHQTKNVSYTMELMKAEKADFPASLFVIPAGYSKSSYNLMFKNMMEAGMQARNSRKSN